jgi:hypothetical protein
MKTTIVLALISFYTFSLTAQSQAETFIKEAQAYLAQKDYKMAQLSLQDAINDLNTLMAGQIGEALPAEINGLKSTEAAEINGAMGMIGGGMQITKQYNHPTKKENNAEVSILANSPMLASINMYMNNPAMMGQEYKSVRVGTQRAIMKSENEDYYDSNGTTKEVRQSELQIPLNQTLITIQMRGFASEAEELAFASKLDIAKLKTLLGE